MKLFELTHNRIYAGGYKKPQKFNERRTNVVLLLKGGVKLDSVRHCDRL